MEWPGFDHPPVVIQANARPRRPRLGTDFGPQRGQRYYVGANGELLIPANAPGFGVPHRSASVSAPRPPANIIINNDQINEVEYDYEDRHRRRSNGLILVDGHSSRARSHSRSRYSPSFEEDYEMKRKMERLEELEKKAREADREERLKEKLLLERAKEEEEERERVKEEKELKKKAIEEYEIEQAKKREKEEAEKKAFEKAVDERLREKLRRNGVSEHKIERIIKQDKQQRKDDDDDDDDRGSRSKGKETRIVRLDRPTYIRVKAKHLEPETLDLYELPWEWDDDDDSYIIIKRWVNERDQEILFEHTRKLRETKQLTYTTTELRKQHDQLVLIKKKDRKKSPAKKGWLFT